MVFHHLFITITAYAVCQAAADAQKATSDGRVWQMVGPGMKQQGFLAAFEWATVAESLPRRAFVLPSQHECRSYMLDVQVM